ncbi:hypothetical protein FHS40_005897 [Streptomyces spectabilis]|uniref:Uncharacterized protein n=1 Tax=Streptomyces spectabilis TaxID=68270 RepID=A0A7W8EX85_STRST|nr:hypothetical protein [Streptomyces spectabilis]
MSSSVLELTRSRGQPLHALNIVARMPPHVLGVLNQSCWTSFKKLRELVVAPAWNPGTGTAYEDRLERDGRGFPAVDAHAHGDNGLFCGPGQMDAGPAALPSDVGGEDMGGPRVGVRVPNGGGGGEGEAVPEVLVPVTAGQFNARLVETGKKKSQSTHSRCTGKCLPDRRNDGGGCPQPGPGAELLGCGQWPGEPPPPWPSPSSMSVLSVSSPRSFNPLISGACFEGMEGESRRSMNFYGLA